jgi:hypothetical protein
MIKKITKLFQKKEWRLRIIVWLYAALIQMPVLDEYVGTDIRSR